MRGVGAVAITICLTVASVTGLQIIGGIDAETSATCMGLWGCGLPNLRDAGVLAILLFVILGVVVWANRGGIPPRIR